MAELVSTQSGRVGVQGVGGAVTPSVNFQPADVSVGLREQARMQNTTSQTIDRLTSMIFGQAEKQSVQAGLQFAAENPLTRQQLDAMVKGDMSKVNLGSPLNVFDSALRKARAFELSAHAETEATSQLLDLYQQAERGEIDFDAVKNKVKSVTDGYGSALAQVDPESSFKYRASLATMGNKVIDETAKLEQKKRLIANSIKVQRSYQDFLRISEMYVNGDMPIDEATGEPFNKDAVVDMLAANFLNNAITMVGVNGAAQYQAQILKDLTDVKVNALTKFMAEDFAQDPLAFQKLKSGDAGRMTDVWATLPEDGKNQVMAAYLTKIGTDNNIKDQQDKANKVEREIQAIDLYKQVAVASGPKKRELLTQLAELRVFSFDDLRKLDRGEGDSNPMALYNAIDGIYNGTINNSEQIKKLPISVPDKIKMLEKLHSNTKSEDRALDSGLRRLAGIPEGLVALDPKGAEFGRLRKFQADAQELKAQALREGKIMSNAEVLDKLSAKVEERRNTEQAKAAKMRLQSYEAKTGPITAQNIDAVVEKIKAGKVKGMKPTQAEQVRNTFKQSQGDE